MKRHDWYNCYGNGWTADDIIPAAFSHPAKFSKQLIRRIYSHLLTEGYIRPGDKVADPFGGVALGGFWAMRYGLDWYGVELEQKFHRLGQGMDCPGFNKSYWKRYVQRGRKWNELNICPDCAALLDASYKDLPFLHWFGTVRREIPERKAHRFNGNIERWNGFCFGGTARLVQGDSRLLADLLGGVGCVVSSPPYAGSVNSDLGGIDWEKAGRPDRLTTEAAGIQGANGHKMKYGRSPGQLGSMPEGDYTAVISSPPYADAVANNGEGPGARFDPIYHNGDNATKKSSANGYGVTAGNLGNLAAVVSSPPFENCNTDIGAVGNTPGMRQQIHNSTKRPDSYGQTPGNIGNQTGQTFWQAAHTIISQCHEILRPGGVAAFVTGDYVRKGQRVEFGRQWLELCEAIGFTAVEHITAWKREPGPVQAGIFEDKDLTVDRISFFRRLANQKNPENEIVNEDVWIVVKG